jgi:hypothetical protein
MPSFLWMWRDIKVGNKPLKLVIFYCFKGYLWPNATVSVRSDDFLQRSGVLDTNERLYRIFLGQGGLGRPASAGRLFALLSKLVGRQGTGDR